MPRIKPTRTACILVLSAALTSVVLFYPSAISASIHDSLYPDEYLPIDPLSLTPDSGVSGPPVGNVRKLGNVHGGGKGRQWGWLSYLYPSTIEDDEEVDGVEIVYADDGLVRGWESTDDLTLPKTGYIKVSETVRKRHPILELIEKGQEKWAALLERQSKTLPQAVIEYRKRYGRNPPKGFESWWKFARQNNIKIVDDYDQIDRDVLPYFALSPKMFRDRCELLEETPHSYKITLDPHGPSSVTGVRATGARPRLLFSLLEPMAQYLPRSITFIGSDHDLGSALLGDDLRQAALQAIEGGNYLTTEQLGRLEKRLGRVVLKGTASACPVGSLGWNTSLAAQEGRPVEPPHQETTFVHDPRATYDFCSNPSLLKQHGAFSYDFPRDTVLRPLFQWSKHLRNPEFLATPLEAYENSTSEKGRAMFTPWTEKTDSRVFWRGSSTGDSYSKVNNYRPQPWTQSHRPRLSLMAQAKEGVRGVWVRRGKQWVRESWGNGRLNWEYLDVGLSGKPHQCKEEDGTCQEMRDRIQFRERVAPEDAAKYKFALDVDGNGWSSRFHRLMMSGSVVIKSTIYPEWISDWIIPWVHYVPIQVDYSDLYNVMSFFTGPPDAPDRGGRGPGKGGLGGYDDLARQIADQARSFGEEHWRWEDMQGYMFRLLLEYARLQADNREEWSYTKEY